MKTCYKCKLAKEETEFWKDRSTFDGLTNRCKICASEYRESRREQNNIASARWRRRHPEQAKTISRKSNASRTPSLNRKYSLNSKYGISIQDCDKLVKEQAGKCKICEKIMVKPYIDHCHETGKVRGLLCSLCNLGVGHFKDSTKALQSAMFYLEDPDWIPCGTG